MEDKRRNSGLRFEFPVAVKVVHGGYAKVRIVDISTPGLQFWSDDNIEKKR